MSRSMAALAPTDAAPRVTVDDVVSGCLFVAVFLFFWVAIDPFVDLTDPSVLLPSEGSNLANQIVVVALAFYCLVYAAFSDMRRFSLLLSPALAVLLAWLLVCAATSVDPVLSARRYVLSFIVFAICAVMLVLPRDRDRFADLLAVSVLIVLAICYGGVLLAPDYAIHSGTELLETEHEGHWRGSFHHKNAAGAAMVMAVFIGLYVAKVRHRLLGWFIAAASAYFLARTMAKTSMAMVVPALALAWLVTAVRSTLVRCLLVLGAIALISLVTVGSVVLPPIRAFNESALADPTFTNRTDIWAYAVGRIMERPVLGHGFEAFWGSNEVFFGESASWANRATNAHSGYVDAVLTTGVPGLILLLWAFVITPLRDLKAAETSGNDPATTLLYMRILLFGIFFACLESFFFSNGGPVWFLFLVALFGMRFQARARHVGPLPGSARRDSRGKTLVS